MSKKTSILFVILFVAAAMISALTHAQSPSQSQAPPPPPAQSDIQTSSVDSQGISRYLLGPGDILDVRVFAEPGLNSTVEIDSDGAITSLPFIEEPIPARCRNEKEIQKSITDAYSKYLVKPRVSVRVLERRSRPPAVVFGAVRSPARVTMTRRLRLLELLAAAGGITAGASGSIQLVHTAPEMCPEPGEPVMQAIAANTPSADIGRIEVFQIDKMKTGAEGGNPLIRAGDIVIVTEGEPVYITGAVNMPREIVLKENMTLQQALAIAGGPQKLAKTSEVYIYRRRDGVIGSDKIVVNYDAIRKGTQKDIALQSQDIIEVRNLGALAPKSVFELLLGVGRGTLGALPMRIPY